jgi:hypothetical protein
MSYIASYRVIIYCVIFMYLYFIPHPVVRLTKFLDVRNA